MWRWGSVEGGGGGGVGGVIMMGLSKEVAR